MKIKHPNTNNQKIIMIREDLNKIPQYELPQQYSVKWYSEGDENIWLDIHYKSEKFLKITPTLYRKEFGTNKTILSERQFFILNEKQEAIGTCTAWYGNFNKEAYGRIHWVAIIPEYQGKGLGKVLMTIGCNRLKELGHTKAYLTTSILRQPAVNLYKKFGFSKIDLQY